MDDPLTLHASWRRLSAHLRGTGVAVDTRDHARCYAAGAMAALYLLMDTTARLGCGPGSLSGAVERLQDQVDAFLAADAEEREARCHHTVQ